MSSKITKQQLLENFSMINEECKKTYILIPSIFDRILFQIVWSDLTEDVEILSFYFDSFNLTVEEIFEYKEEMNK